MQCTKEKEKKKRIFSIFFSFLSHSFSLNQNLRNVKFIRNIVYTFLNSRKRRDIEGDRTEVDICRFHSGAIKFLAPQSRVNCESLVDKHRIFLADPLFSAWLILMSRESSRFLQFRATGNASNFRISGLRLGNAFSLFLS